jgi:hypothetical protein
METGRGRDMGGSGGYAHEPAESRGTCGRPSSRIPVGWALGSGMAPTSPRGDGRAVLCDRWPAPER